MTDDHALVLQGISDMMNSLPLISWRLVIISMTPHEAVAVETFPLLPGDSDMDALVMFSQNVNNGYEQGFESVYQFIENNEFARQWLRNDAALLTVFVSDEDDQSSSRFPTVQIFKNWLDSIREHVYVSSITNLMPDDFICNNFSQRWF